ncbi:MAG: hypothetical protein E7253_02130 [Lachnospiraceae bacterium]|nr:hypothetical protein [Lachnospiraceae bacterium]
MWILKYMFLGFISTAFGFIVAGGYLALISLIGIVPRLASISKTSKYIIRYENAIIYGVVIGSITFSYPVSLEAGPLLSAAAGLFSGIFIGCLAGALAEVVNVIPIFSRRVKLRKGIPYVIYALGIGKGVGVLIQYYIMK